MYFILRRDLIPTNITFAINRKRITGADLDTCNKWTVCGTDLGIPFLLENRAVGFLFGDTFSTYQPEGPDNNGGVDHRSPVMLRSHSQPSTDSVIWDNAAGLGGDGMAPELFGTRDGEFTRIPNDGIAFPETKQQIISFMSINRWKDLPPNKPPPANNAGWQTNYAGLAYSDNGNTFHRTDLKWPNHDDNLDPFQMWSMQRFNEFVYIFSVRAGRVYGPMMLRRVRWDRMFFPNEYQCWGNNVWGPPGTCTPLFEDWISEPSVRRLDDGTWVMAYLNPTLHSIVTRTATGPEQKWSNSKIQLTEIQESALYGGFIHPYSSSRPNDLHLMVSTWKKDNNGRTTQYHVSHYSGSV